MTTAALDQTRTSAQKRASRPGKWQITSIVDGRKLRVQLTAAALENLHDESIIRKRALDLLHGAWFRGRMIAQERLQAGADGLDTARLLSAVQDEVLSALYDFTTTHIVRARNPTEGERLSVMATGGYGRGALAPSSDIDLLFLRPYKQTPWAESVIEYMLYMLWDMGLRVGHAFRSIDECIRLSKEDITIQTSLLDARYLFGDRELADEFVTRFDRDIRQGGERHFIAEKLAERDTRHKRHGGSRYVVEPNIKNGKGGLRDLQTLFWLVKFVYGGASLEQVLGTEIFAPEEARTFQRAARFLWTVRCQLHFITGREEDRLSFDLQPELAARFGYTDSAQRLGVERFMKRYFLVAKDVGSLTRTLCARLEADHQKQIFGIRRLLPSSTDRNLTGTGFELLNGRITISDPDHFVKSPSHLVQIFKLADELGLDIHPEAMSAASRSLSKVGRALKSEPEAHEAFLTLLTARHDPGAALQLMNDAGVLGRLIPEFGGIVGQTQFNMYHHYTVDEHTIRAVEVLAAIDRGEAIDLHPLSTTLIHRIENKRALYLAMLLHDTGKGRGDQQVEGAQTSRRASKRLGLSDGEANLISWLVGNHLLMSETAQKRDISDPRTVQQFAEKVGSIERLRLLLLLTVADIRAVGPDVWNGWKGQLLRDLYYATETTLRGGRTDERSISNQLNYQAEDNVHAFQERYGHVPAIMRQLEPSYWTANSLDTLNWHAQTLRSATGDLAIASRSNPESGATEFFVSAADRVGLFSDMVGAFASEGASIAAAQVCTGQSAIIDTFILQDDLGQPFAFEDPGRVSRLCETVQSAIEHGFGARKFPKIKQSRRAAAFIVEPSVQIDSEASTDNTVIDVSGRDRPALLFDIASTFSDLGLEIQSAHISSFGERVFDAFYVQNGDGKKLTDEAVIDELKSELLDVLGRQEPDVPKTPARSLARAKPANSF